MPSINFRSGGVPQGCIVISLQNMPYNYSNETSINDKFIHGVSSSEDPGSNIGSSAHTHGSGVHQHSAIHSHSGSTGISNDTDDNDIIGNFNGAFGRVGHTHKITVNNKTTNTASDGGHNHSNDNDIKTTNVGIYKKISLINIRNKQIPHGTIIILDQTNLPNGFSDASLENYIVNKTPLGVINNTNSHSHTSSTGHTHVIGNDSHRHSLGTKTGGVYEGPFNVGGFGISGNHIHTLSSSTSATKSAGQTTIPNDGEIHTHDSSSLSLAEEQVKFVKNSIVNIRYNDVQKNTIFIWLGSISNIPTNYQNTIIDRYIRNGTPGTREGSNSHDHDNAISHNHEGTFDTNHSHTTSGTGNTEEAGSDYVLGSPLQNYSANNDDHSHLVGTVSGSSYKLFATTHSCPSVDHKPPTIKVAFIKKL